MQRREFLKKSLYAGGGVLLGLRLRNQFNIIIKGATVFDGSGRPARIADIGIDGEKIKAIGDLSRSSADTWIDAQGLAAAPGFIDIHTHTDIELIVNPFGESKLLQGVTTEVSGNCGDSPFPLTDDDAQSYRTSIREQYGLEPDWHDFNGFRQAIIQSRPAINYATFLGHGALRAYVLGRNDVQPSPEQLRTLQNILSAHLELGVLGLSTGLEYAPGSYARTEELIALCRIVAQADGVYATHMRNEDDHVEEALQEALTICRKSGVSLQVSHLKACNQNNWPKEPLLLAALSQAADEGLPVAADRYPYEAWSTGLTSFLPLWARQGTTDEVLARLQDASLIPLLAEYAAGRSQRIGGWDKIVISSCTTTPNKIWEGKPISVCAQEADLQPFEFIRQLLLAERGQVNVIGFAMSYDNLKQTLTHPLVGIGSDGNALADHGILARGKPHPRSFGTFPRVLGHFVREQKIMDLATAIHKMTQKPAEKLNLKRRGLLLPGYYADLVLFDPQTVSDRATYSQPHQYPVGIEHVIVNGTHTVQNGKLTERRNGRFLSQYSR